MKKLLLLVCALLLVLNRTLSCDCDTSYGFAKCDVVFIGKVMKIEAQGQYKITLRVHEILKGKQRSKTIVVYTPCLTDPCCGIDFKVGSIYKIFALYNDGELATNQCTETTRLK